MRLLRSLGGKRRRGEENTFRPTRFRASFFFLFFFFSFFFFFSGNYARRYDNGWTRVHKPPPPPPPFIGHAHNCPRFSMSLFGWSRLELFATVLGERGNLLPRKYLKYFLRPAVLPTELLERIGCRVDYNDTRFLRVLLRIIYWLVGQFDFSLEMTDFCNNWSRTISLV